jgi:outer membrane biosynthesis protein TonB
MHEYVTVSASSYDPAALATKLTEKSADGWDVVSIVQTGGDVTAFLRRSSESGTSPGDEAEPVLADTAPDDGAEPVTEAGSETEPEPVPISSWSAEPEPTPEPEPAPEPEPEPEPVSEPAGWGVAPIIAADATPERTPEPEPAVDPMPTTVYTPDPTPAATPEPAAAAETAAAAAAAPAVPAGWYADPSGRFELRYWDGSAWTEHVARGGQQFTDPPVA